MTEAPEDREEAFRRHPPRRATPEDAAELARLLHDFNLEYDYPTPGVEALATRCRRLLAAGQIQALIAAEERAVGISLFHLRPSVWTGALDAYLEELYVVPELRGRGIGRRLLEATMDAAREAGAAHIELNTGESDAEARALYESSGFTNREGSPDGPPMLYYERDL